MRGQRILFDQIENYVNHTLYIAFPLTKSQPSWIHVEDCGLICNPVLSMTIIKTSTILEGQWLVVSEHLVKTSAICILTIYSKDIVQFNHMPSSQTERKFQRHDTMTQNLAQLNSNQFFVSFSTLYSELYHITATKVQVQTGRTPQKCMKEKHFCKRNIKKRRSSYKQQWNSEVKGKRILNDVVEARVCCFLQKVLVEHIIPAPRNPPALSLSDGYAHFGMLLMVLERPLLTLKSALCSQNSPHHLV